MIYIILIHNFQKVILFIPLPIPITRVGRKDNIIEIDIEEKKAIEIKYADGMNNEND